MPFSTGHLWMVLIILVVVLIIWGPGKLPDLGAGMGRAIREFKKTSSEARDYVEPSTAADSVVHTPPGAPAPPQSVASGVETASQPKAAEEHKVAS